MVEQGTHKPLVVGSNPSLATSILRVLSRDGKRNARGGSRERLHLWE